MLGLNPRVKLKGTKQHCDVLIRRLGQTSVSSEWVPHDYKSETLKSKLFSNCNMLCAENSDGLRMKFKVRDGK